jgi:hypothetical protein
MPEPFFDVIRKRDDIEHLFDRLARCEEGVEFANPFLLLLSFSVFSLALVSNAFSMVAGTANTSLLL